MVLFLRSAWHRTEKYRLPYHRRGWVDDGVVNVLIPTHNRVDLLMSRAIPSVLGQIYKPVRIIVAAHGCTDDTVKWASSVAEVIEVPRKRTYPPTAENHWFAGPVAPLNAALESVRGSWIARIDDDDVWLPDHLERLVEFARAQDHEFVSSAYEREKDGRREIVRHEDGIGGTQTWLYRSYLRFMKYNPDCWKKQWNRVNDTDLADRIRKAGVRVGWLDAVTAQVLPRPGETTIGLEAYRRDRQAKENHFAF